MPRLGVVGATGAVGTVELELLAERGYDDVRAFASERSAGTRVPYGGAELEVELASPETLTNLDLCFFDEERHVLTVGWAILRPQPAFAGLVTPLP